MSVNLFASMAFKHSARFGNAELYKTDNKNRALEDKLLEDKLNKIENDFLDNARESIVTRFLKPYFTTTVNMSEANKTFKAALVKHVKKGKTLEEIAENIALELKHYNRPNISFSCFQNDVHKALIEFLKAKRTIKEHILDELIKYNSA